MSKEPLEKIIELLEDKAVIDRNDFEWLIKRAQELKEDNENLQILSNINRKEHMRLHEQNKRYRKALEFYAEGKHVAYKLDETDDDLVVDYGETARQALEGDSE